MNYINFIINSFPLTQEQSDKIIGDKIYLYQLLDQSINNDEYKIIELLSEAFDIDVDVINIYGDMVTSLLKNIFSLRKNAITDKTIILYEYTNGDWNTVATY